MIQKKLIILQDNGIIDQEAYDFNIEVLELLKEREIINKEEEADTFMTHLAMAMSRGEEEEIDAMDDSVLKEIQADNRFEDAQKLWSEIQERSPMEFPPNESGYFYLHLVNLL